MQNLTLLQIGTIIILIGMVFVIIGVFKGTKTSSSSTNIAVGGFIGPIPFGFANNQILMYVLIGLMVFTLAVWTVFNFYT